METHEGMVYLHTFIVSALDTDEMSASLSGRFTFPGTYIIGVKAGWVGPDPVWT
jgi:hypothetical protein